MKQISLHILDIAENSVRAGASQIIVILEMDKTSDTLRLEITDNGSGMEKETIDRITDPFFSTRTTRKVGLGLPLLKHHAETTGGSLLLESFPGKGTRVVAMFGLNHVDRQPVGDVAGVLVNLAISSPEIDFILDAKSDKGDYHFSSRETASFFEGVPLSSPEVAEALKEMISENLKEIDIV